MFVLPSGPEFLGIKTLNIFICSFLNNENHIYFLLSLSHIVTLSNKALFLYELHGLPKKKRISHYYQEKSLLILVTLKFRLAIVQKDRPYEITLSSIFKPETAQDKQIQQSFNSSGLLSFVLSCTFQTIDLAKTLFRSDKFVMVCSKEKGDPFLR